jgi:hypothetical protein
MATLIPGPQWVTGLTTRSALKNYSSTAPSDAEVTILEYLAR